MDEILKALDLSLNDFNKNSRNEYEYTLENVHEFGKFYSRLDNLESITENPDLSALTTDRSTIVFEGDNIEIRLQSDFDSNEYNLILKED